MRFLGSILAVLVVLGGAPSCGPYEQLGADVYDSAFRSDSTDEALTLTVDPNAIGIRTVQPGIKFTRQIQIDNWGSFASFADAERVVPSNIEHAVRLVHAAGSFSVSDSYFGSLDRFTFGSSGSLALEGAGIAQVSGTSTLTVESLADDFAVTTTADPGYADDLYVDDFIVATGGTGAGDVRVAAAWVDDVVKIAGYVTWDDTTTVQVQRPTTTLSLTGTSTIAIPLPGAVKYHPDGNFVTFKNLRIDSASARVISLTGGRAYFDKVQIRNARLQVLDAALIYGALAMNGVTGNTANAAIAGGFLRASGYTAPGFWRNWIAAYSASGSFAATPSHAWLAGGLVRACSFVAVVGWFNDFVAIDQMFRTISVSDAVVEVSFGGRAACAKAWCISGSTPPTATSGEVKAYGGYHSWADIDAETDFADTMLLANGSVVSLY